MEEDEEPEDPYLEDAEVEEDAEPEDPYLEDAEEEEDAEPEDPYLEDAEEEEDAEPEDPYLEDAEEEEDAEPEDPYLEDAEEEEDAEPEDPYLEDAEEEEDAEPEDPSLEDHFSGLYLTLKNRPAILEDTSDVSYHGRIRSDAAECVVSFPGKFASGWDALIEERYEQSVACVFLCRPEDGLGQHSTNPEAPPGASVRCYCPTIYGERDFKEFGYLNTLPKGM